MKVIRELGTDCTKEDVKEIYKRGNKLGIKVGNKDIFLDYVYKFAHDSPKDNGVGYELVDATIIAKFNPKMKDAFYRKYYSKINKDGSIIGRMDIYAKANSKFIVDEVGRDCLHHKSLFLKIRPFIHDVTEEGNDAGNLYLLVELHESDSKVSDNSLTFYEVG